MHSFTFGGKNLLQFGGRILQAPFHTVAKRNIELVKIYGQSGDEIIDNESYDNVPFSVQICFMPLLAQKTAKELAYAVIDWLAPLQNGYYEYRDTYNPGYFTKAVLTNFESVQRELKTLLTTTLEFSRVPFWYSDAGQRNISIANGSAENVLLNPEQYPAEALYEFWYARGYQSDEISETLNVSINGIEATVNVVKPSGAISRSYYFDTPAKQFYYIDNGKKVYEGNLVLPELNPGENIMKFNLNGSLASGTFRFEVTPNWRRL